MDKRMDMAPDMMAPGMMAPDDSGPDPDDLNPGRDADELPSGYEGVPAFDNADFSTTADAPDTSMPDWAQSRQPSYLFSNDC